MESLLKNLNNASTRRYRTSVEEVSVIIVKDVLIATAWDQRFVKNAHTS